MEIITIDPKCAIVYIKICYIPKSRVHLQLYCGKQFSDIAETFDKKRW